MKTGEGRVLVVDDDKALRDIRSRALASHGRRVRCAAGGEEARREMREPFDVVLVDLVLPGESGIDLLHWIRRTSPSTEVIVITGHATVETAIRAIEYGAFDYIQKPFDLREISHTVSRAAEKNRLRAENERLIAELKESRGRLEESARGLEETVRRRTADLGAAREETEKKARQLAIINEISNALTSSLELEEVLRIVVREIKKLIQFDRLSIAMLNETRTHSRVYFMEPPMEGMQGAVFPLDGTGIRWVAGEKRPLIRGRLQGEASFAEDEFIHTTGMRSGIVVPLLYRGEVTGTLNLGSAAEAAYARGHEEILQQIGGQIAIALENARLYRELKRYSDTLEQRVDERTAALRRNLKELEEAQRNLVQSEKLAATSKLVAGVAHEIRNPLNSMSFATANIQRALTLGEISRVRELCGESIGILRSDIARLKDMVDKFMAFTKPAAITLEETDLNELAANVVRGVREMFAEAGIELREGYGDGMPRLRVERDAFHHTILNLLLNARDATPRGGHVAVRTRSDKDRVVVEVEDDGCGIPAEIRDKIFDIFFTTKAEGAGLGLSQVYRTVESHRGTIALAGGAGSGTVFTISLPRD